MRVIAAVDLLHGQVVRGIAGNRGDYRPIQTMLCATSEPVDVINALRQECGIGEFYIADLDAILQGQRNWKFYEFLEKEGLKFWLDAGLRSFQQLRELSSCGIRRIVIGLETWSGLHDLKLGLMEYKANIMFSLDMKGGQLLNQSVTWDGLTPDELVLQLSQTELKELFLLDLATVGTGKGLPTISLLRQAKSLKNDWQIITGGGVRGLQDLYDLKENGADGCVLASALHDGSISREQLLELIES